MLKRQAQEAVEDMEEMRRTHKDNANVSMQLLKKVLDGVHFLLVPSHAPREHAFRVLRILKGAGGHSPVFGYRLSVAVM